MPNRLTDASSPYLRQHAGNPVDWYEWSQEAFERARGEDKPVFLSVGYSSCHWCHVMAHESFEDTEVAGVLNDRFVAVKVDREERPDIDSVYMTAVQAMTGQGGWPMSVFLTPDGTPFFGGTYWPRDSRQGMPGFLQVLTAVDTAWRDQRDQVLATGGRLARHLQAANDLDGGAATVDAEVADTAAQLCVRAWDRDFGGFGQAPKFPQAMTIDFLLAHHVRTGDAGALEAAVHSLEAMSLGGIHDHVGGGFARYSVDAVWLVPHFEKMLYDNALLLRAYTHAAQVCTEGSRRQRRFRRVAADAADYLLREMRAPEGGFYSATDADSEGVEGRYFTWSAAEFDEVVAAAGEDPAVFRRFYGVTEQGNFTDPHHPQLPRTSILHEDVARDEDDAGFTRRLQRVRGALYERREQRVHPGLDDKILVSWNALAIGALAEAGVALGEPRYVQAARDCARFLREHLVDTTDPTRPRLFHTWKAGHGAGVPAFLEDVAYLAQALLVLYEADPDRGWFTWACDLAGDTETRFAERDEGGEATGAYFATADDAEALLTRPKDLWDNATPGGASVMADVNLRLAALTGEAAYADRAERTLALFAARATQAPTGYGELLRDLERLAVGSREVAVVGDPSSPEVAALVAV
ncbi:MAG: thioredoxin domain-containing protein, partial [Euzebyales bacterium]|nr:thioredoxin domain-containing protein [Euzebyales bacterium]